MGDRFVVCSGCSRHAKAHEAHCPFCRADLAAARPSTGEPFRRMAAAAAVAAGVVALPGCGNHSAAAFYGSPGIVQPVLDSGGASNDGASDAPSAIVFYGSPNFDAVAPMDTGTPKVDAGEPADGSGDGQG